MKAFGHRIPEQAGYSRAFLHFGHCPSLDGDSSRPQEDDMQIKGVLFDRDGTLIDFHRTWSPAFREAAMIVAEGNTALADSLLSDAGYDLVSDRAVGGSLLAGASDAELAAFWAGMLDGRNENEILALIAPVFAGHLSGGATPVCDLERFCEELAGLGMVLGIATNGSSPSSENMMRKHRVHHHFNYFAGFDTVERPKPHPEMAYGFCAATGLEPAEVAMVGDSPHDLEMARAARTGLAIAVLSGASPEAELAPLADYVIPDISILPDLFRNLASGTP
jgi:phosphoglycolate phosphatase